MTEQLTQGYQLMQIIRIMNQFRRMAIESAQQDCVAGMTVPQLGCIGFLIYQGQRDTFQRDIESCFKLRRSTVSSLLNTLERKGLLRRVSVAQDARLKKLELTEAGRQIGEQVQTTIDSLNRQFIQDLDPEERRTLSAILNKIEAGLAARCP